MRQLWSVGSSCLGRGWGGGHCVKDSELWSRLTGNECHDWLAMSAMDNMGGGGHSYTGWPSSRVFLRSFSTLTACDLWTQQNPGTRKLGKGETITFPKRRVLFTLSDFGEEMQFVWCIQTCFFFFFPFPTLSPRNREQGQQCCFWVWWLTRPGCLCACR